MYRGLHHTYSNFKKITIGSILQNLKFTKKSAIERDGYDEFFSDKDKEQVRKICKYVESNQQLITL